MQFTWIDYTKEYEETVESWMDDEAKRNTGCDDGWAEYLDYWMNEPGTRFGENFWCKMVYDGPVPVSVIAIAEEKGEMIVSEVVVCTEKRRQGIGTAVLTELLYEHREILGKSIESAMAVIYPGNIASQKAFEKAGFHWESAHPDGDAWYYRWKPASINHDAHSSQQHAD